MRNYIATYPSIAYYLEHWSLPPTRPALERAIAAYFDRYGWSPANVVVRNTRSENTYALVLNLSPRRQAHEEEERRFVRLVNALHALQGYDLRRTYETLWSL